MLKNTRTKSRGDTLIEVLFATTVFSLVAVGGMAIMNQGTATSQRALEITLVRNEIDAQAETLRFLNASYIAAYSKGFTPILGTSASGWKSISDAATAAVLSPLDTVCPITSPNQSFILDTKNAKYHKLSTDNFVSTKPYSQVYYGGSGDLFADGIWIEAIKSKSDPSNLSESNIGYIDFYIRACWGSPGQSVPITMGTIVRLYEPR